MGESSSSCWHVALRSSTTGASHDTPPRMHSETPTLLSCSSSALMLSQALSACLILPSSTLMKPCRTLHANATPKALLAPARSTLLMVARAQLATPFKQQQPCPSLPHMMHLRCYCPPTPKHPPLCQSLRCPNPLFASHLTSATFSRPTGCSAMSRYFKTLCACAKMHISSLFGEGAQICSLSAAKQI
jgi:hypothetical protein